MMAIPVWKMRRRPARPHKTSAGRLADRMNSTERQYADLLEGRRLTGDILEWRYEPFSLRLADNTHYRPDFMVVTPECIEIHEVKGGFWQDDSRAKWKVAAEQFPVFLFVAAVRKKGEWLIEKYDAQERVPELRPAVCHARLVRVRHGRVYGMLDRRRSGDYDRDRRGVGVRGGVRRVNRELGWNSKICLRYSELCERRKTSAG